MSANINRHYILQFLLKSDAKNKLETVTQSLDLEVVFGNISSWAGSTEPDFFSKRLEARVSSN